ncbi:hypothetical protein LY76DRAFT_287628 [Colletotrichum caudatum]|nr:hypothetical protein LY76DRAFT_287628 [Colletotrichum caudatum]
MRCAVRWVVYVVVGSALEGRGGEGGGLIVCCLSLRLRPDEVVALARLPSSSPGFPEVTYLQGVLAGDVNYLLRSSKHLRTGGGVCGSRRMHSEHAVLCVVWPVNGHDRSACAAADHGAANDKVRTSERAEKAKHKSFGLSLVGSPVRQA